MKRLRTATAARKPAAKKERVCVRCKCRDSRACAGGCSWVSNRVDICDRCLSADETVLVMGLDKIQELFEASKHAVQSWAQIVEHMRDALLRRITGAELKEDKTLRGLMATLGGDK